MTKNLDKPNANESKLNHSHLQGHMKMADRTCKKDTCKEHVNNTLIVNMSELKKEREVLKRLIPELHGRRLPNKVWRWHIEAQQRLLERVLEEVLSDHHKLAKLFHNEYEGAAEKYGWKTNKKTRVKFENLPPENLQLMLGTCKLVLWHLRSKLQSLSEELEEK
jgi:hypothetical protein